LEYRFALRQLTLVERGIRRVAHARLTAIDGNQFLGNARITSGHCIQLLHAPAGRHLIGATPGVGPAAALSGAGSTVGSTGCSGSTNLSQSGAPYDGGGIPGDASVSCAPTRGLDVSGPVTLRSSVGRAGIPLGSTELGGAGLSAVAPVPAPSGFSLVSSPGKPASLATSFQGNAQAFQSSLSGTPL